MSLAHPIGICVLFLIPLFPSAGLAQTSAPQVPIELNENAAALPLQSSSQSSGPHRIRILRISDPIKIDGHLDEPAWSQAEAATDFRQQSPTEGAPASEKTEVRVLFDNKNVYL